MVTTFPGRSFGKRRIFSRPLSLSLSLVLSPFLFRSRSRIVPSLSRPTVRPCPARVEFRRVLLCMSLQGKGLRRGELSCRIQRDDRGGMGRPETRGGPPGEEEGQRGRERNDNPFGGHNAELGTVKLTRQEIRPTNQPLSFCPSLSLSLPLSSLSLSLSLRFPLFIPSLSAASLPPAFLLAPLPHGELTPGYMQTAIVPPSPPLPRASHKLTELYYADPLPLCPRRLSSPLCSRDAASHSSVFISTSFCSPLAFVFLINRGGRSQQGTKHDGVL